jgi:DNA-directed RNA polymerase specialized sigma24 family protein
MAHTGGDAPRAPDEFADQLSLLSRLQIHALLRSRLDPSGAVQETLLVAHQNSGQFRGRTDAGFAAWLFVQ